MKMVELLSKAINWICKRENVTLIIALIGAIGTIYNLIYNWKTKRAKLGVTIIEYSHFQKIHNILIGFENMSQLPISISRISIIHDSVEYPCHWIPQKIKAITDNNWHTTTEYSLALPFTLASLGSACGYFVFRECPHIFSEIDKPLTFQIYTNRGKPLRVLVPLDKERCLRY